MTTKVPTAVLVVAVVSGCTVATVPRHFPVPEDAQNPIVIRYEGASVGDIVNIVAKVCSDVPIPTAQVVPDKGYVETRWIDIATMNLGPPAQVYPARERAVLYAFQVQETGENAGVIEISAWYQPTRPSQTPVGRSARYDRLLPTDHLGYQVALQLEFRIKRELALGGIQVVEPQETQGT
jgi:hypothetical protein